MVYENAQDYDTTHTTIIFITTPATTVLMQLMPKVSERHQKIEDKIREYAFEDFSQHLTPRKIISFASGVAAIAAAIYWYSQTKDTYVFDVVRSQVDNVGADFGGIIQGLPYIANDPDITMSLSEAKVEQIQDAATGVMRKISGPDISTQLNKITPGEITPQTAQALKEAYQIIETEITDQAKINSAHILGQLALVGVGSLNTLFQSIQPIKSLLHNGKQHYYLLRARQQVPKSEFSDEIYTIMEDELDMEYTDRINTYDQAKNFLDLATIKGDNAKYFFEKALPEEPRMRIFSVKEQIRQFQIRTA